MSNILFLKALRDKLKVGNTRSIHLNALPGNSATKLDLADLNIIKAGLADTFIELLTSKANFEFEISIKNSSNKETQAKLFLLAKRLNTIVLQNEDEFKEHGVKSFALGYPVLVKRFKKDPTRIIKAPLFIWQLDITMGSTANSWKIVRNKSKNEKGNYVNDDIHSISLNEVLLSFLSNDEQVNISQISDDLLDDFVLDKAEIVAESTRFMTTLTGALNEEEIYNLKTKVSGFIEKLPTKQDVDESGFTVPYLVGGGTFGLYQSQKESIIKDLDRCIDECDKFEFENLNPGDLKVSPFSAVETDPSQQSILNNLGIETKQIIQGPPGTGKSQTLTALITNAMANSLKVLVVCEKKTALDVIRHNIHKESDKLGSLVAVIDDIVKDRDMIVSSVRDRIGNMQQNAPANELQYETVKSTIKTVTAIINEQHQALDKRLYQGMPWSHLVGTYFKRKKLASPDFLNQHLDHKAFSFSRDQSELNRFVQIVKEGEALYAKLKSAQSEYDLLADKVFLRSDSPRAIHLELIKVFQHYEQDLQQRIQQIRDALDAYRSFLSGHFSAYHDDMSIKISSFLSYMEENENSYGSSFVKNDTLNKLKIDLLSLISKKYKALKRNRKAIPELHSEISSTYNVYKYFEHQFKVLTDDDSYELLKLNILDLQKLNNEWQSGVPILVDKLVANLSAQSIHPSYGNRADELQQLETGLQESILRINNDGWLVRTITRAAALGDNLVALQEVLQDIKTVLASQDDFVVCYEWRHYYLKQDQLAKNLLSVFSRSGHIHWSQYFESWYYYWLLDQNEMKELPRSDEKLLEYTILKPQLKGPQVRNTLWQWENRQQKSMQDAKSEKRNPVSLYNKRGSKGERRNSLRKIIDTDFNLFTSFYPVVMTNPSVCASILPLKEGLFDIVVFDEASQLRLEDTFTSLIRGKIKIVSGDSQQMPPSSYFATSDGGGELSDEDNEDEIDWAAVQRTNEESRNLADSESLLDYAERNNYKSSMLKVHYRSQHPDLIQFSNHSFYGNQLIPIPAQIDYLPIKVHDVNGLYDDQQNISEATRVVELLLNDIQADNDGKYPSVGVATLNLKQRNLISMELIKVIQTSDNPAHVKKLNDLYEAGLFVKNLENIQGDERDIIILSTTFGRKADGTFRQNFGPLLRSHGYKLLNVIITRAKRQLHICTSIPPDRISDFKEIIERQGTTGRGAFYAFLAYAKAISDGDRITSSHILKQVLQNSTNRTFTITGDALGSESPFEEEVYYELAKCMGEERIVQQHWSGNFRIDMVIKPLHPSQPLMAIECDGAKFHSSNEAYAWDVFRQKELERQGYIFHRIWSTNWWRNQKQEVEKLVEFVQARDRVSVRPVSAT
ncbi:MAG: hypothetical protein JST83_02780 [Bacteroidetes bacterium]|nr:hypothetical protein [Bacteroidota bacterium]